MPKKLNPTTDRRVYNAIAELTRHMRGCKQCVGARKSKTPRDMCLEGALKTLQAADYFADVIRLRVAAHTQHPDAIYACPDIVSHGATYALTAPAYQVVAIQDSLF